jgi:hypothetical protein
MRRYRMGEITGIEIPAKRAAVVSVAPGGRHFAIWDPGAKKVALWSVDASGCQPGSTFGVSGAAQGTALHPDGQWIVLLLDDRAEVVDRAGQQVAAIRLPSTPDATKQAIFSSSGATLWLVYESPTGDGVRVLGVRTSDWRTLGELKALGERDGTRRLHAHPARELLGLGVVCGEEGSWFSFIERHEDRLTLLPVSFQGGEIEALAGFSGAGDAFYRLTQANIERLRLDDPNDAEASSEAHPEWVEEDDRQILFNWASATLGAYVALGVEEDRDPGEDVEDELDQADVRVRVLHESLTARFEFAPEQDEEEFPLALHGVAEQRLLVKSHTKLTVFDLRPWLFLPAEPKEPGKLVCDRVYQRELDWTLDAVPEDAAQSMWLLFTAGGRVEGTWQPRDEEPSVGTLRSHALLGGTYRVQGAKLDIELTSRGGTMQYTGWILPDGLVLEEAADGGPELVRFTLA